MNFLSTSILSAISTFIKLLSNLILNKVIAIYIGPSGIALIGQFQNFLSLATTLGNGATNSGVTKYVAEYNEEDIEKRDLIISASFKIAFIISIITGTILIIGSGYFSQIILNSYGYKIIFKLLGFLLILISLNSILLSIINGLKLIKLFITINITSSFISLLLMTVLTIKFALMGALVASILVQSLVFIVTILMVRKKIVFSITMGKINQEIYVKLFKYSLMAIISTLSVTISQMLIRKHLITELSTEQAGYWQSVWMISSMYLMILTTAFSTYYLPKLSELKLIKEIHNEIVSGYKIILPFVAVTSLVIYLLRDLIIMVLFTTDFLDMRDLFLYQMIGDFFKMASWTLAYLMIAKAMTKTFILTEVWFSAQFYILTVFFVNDNGLIGVTEAYALNYFLYLVLMIIIFRKVLILPKNLIV